MSGCLRQSVTGRVHSAVMSSGWKRVALVALLAVGSSCAVSNRPPARVSLDDATGLQDVSVTSPVVLVTVDGARWQEIFDGTDPSLSHAPFRPSRELVPN